jgi:beta-glucanase (GH16 family)
VIDGFAFTRRKGAAALVMISRAGSEMKRAGWFFIAFVLGATANCRLKGDGLEAVADPGVGSGGESGTGGTQNPGSTQSGSDGIGSGGATNTGGMTSFGGTTGAGGATSSGGASSMGGGTNSGGTTSSGGASSAGGETGSGGTSASDGATGTGGMRDAGTSTSPDGANDSANLVVADAPPEAAIADVGSDARKIDAPLPPGDASDAADAASPDNRPAMTLVWSDEFDGPANTGVDPTKWSYITWNPGQVNNEAQKYTSRTTNVFQNGTGNLVIRALNTPYAGFTYTSGRIESNGHFSFKFGRIEVRAKLPAGIGSFPGIIMMGTTGTWPQSGELALMEQYGQDKSWFYTSAVAGGATGAGDTGNIKYTFPDATTASSDFHVYSLDWYSDHIVFQVDGIEITRTTFATSSPFYTIPEYITLDLALGGTMGGTIAPNAFPMTMTVDYVRVYSF